MSELQHPSRGKGCRGQPTANSEGIHGSICFDLLYIWFVQHLIIREKDKRFRDVYCQEGWEHNLPTLQRPAAGYSEHVTTKPRISIPRITGAYNWLCQNVNSLGICYIEIVKVNNCPSTKKNPTGIYTMISWIIHKRLTYLVVFLQRKFLFPILEIVHSLRYC